MKHNKIRAFGLLPLAIVTVALMSGCMITQPLPEPTVVIAPEPIVGSTGKYMCPYTQDGVLAEWVDNAIQAKIGATIGWHAGTYAGQKAFEKVPFFGGFLWGTVGEAAGRAIAIEASGGWDFIRSTSDLSFNSIDDMAVYLYVTHSSHEHYNDALKATFEIYPQLKKRYNSAIRKAQRRT